MTISSIFISAVSSELRAVRVALARDLRIAGYTVILQEELRYDATTLLDVLAQAIQSCQAAICLVGAGSGGAFPSAIEATPYADLIPPGADRASHTQFEVLLARHHGLLCLFYYPSATLAATLGPLSPEDDPALQARFRTWLEAEGIPRLEFDSQSDLSRKVLTQLHRIQNPSAPPTHGLAPSIQDRFVGRGVFLTDLRRHLTQGSGAAITVAISGMGGVGKTRAATEYAWAHQADYPDGMFLIPAGTADALTANLGNLVTPIGIPAMDARPVQDRYQAVLAWLRARPGWLLILDHVDTEDAMAAAHTLRGVLPGGHVLLTSRLTAVPAGFRGLRLDVLPNDVAAAFLRDATPGRAAAADDPEQALGIARDLGGLALALAHTAAFVERHALSLAAYRRELATAFDRVVGFQGKAVADYERSTLATLTLSLDRATPDGRALLERLAFLADEPVPRALLEVAVPGGEAEDLREAEADLAGYSLLTRDPAAGTFTTHRLVREVVRRRLSEEVARTRLAQALGWVSAAFVGHPQDVRTWVRLVPLAEHAAAVTERAEAAGIDDPTARLMGELGVLFYTRAQHGRAEPLMRRALALDERRLGPDHPGVARDLNNLALLLRSTNRLSEAEPLYRRALSIAEASYGPDHPRVATGLNNLAGLLRATNRLSEAEPLYRRALSIDEASYGPDHPDVARDLNNLAALLRATNRLPEAEPLSRRMVLIFLKFQRATGHPHPHRDAALGNHAHILEALGRSQDAIIAEFRALLAEAGLDGL